MSNALLKTALHNWHASHGGRMVEFGGWSMPVQYASIVEEHAACRQNAALFDVSHMGRLWFSGTQAANFLDSVLTRNVLSTPTSKIRYSLVCNESGGILDDVLLYNLSASPQAPNYLLVVNASNRQKILDRLQPRLIPQVTLTDKTLETGMIALQGPTALLKASHFCESQLNTLGYYQAVETQFCGVNALVSRTGYTGEDGIEIILPTAAVEHVWTTLNQAGAHAAGLGARDTLRLEAAMPLYGHELLESINPLQAGLDFAVNFKNREFIGKTALLQTKAAGIAQQRVGLRLTSRRVPREHYAIYSGNVLVGEVTSGTFSPTLNQPIAMAYIHKEHASLGNQLTVDIRGSREACEVCALPFYTRPS